MSEVTLEETVTMRGPGGLVVVAKKDVKRYKNPPFEYEVVEDVTTGQPKPSEDSPNPNNFTATGTIDKSKLDRSMNADMINANAHANDQSVRLHGQSAAELQTGTSTQPVVDTTTDGKPLDQEVEKAKNNQEDYYSMTVAQLKELAAQRNIDIVSGAKKQDIIDALTA
jgi:hypothetical protein